MQSLAAQGFAFLQILECWLLRLWVRGTLRKPGQGLVEYGLILVLIMVVCVGVLTITGRSISAVWYTKLVNNPAFAP